MKHFDVISTIVIALLIAAELGMQILDRYYPHEVSCTTIIAK